MQASLKYAVVERERRYLLASMPTGETETRQITDRYVSGTRLRLREVREEDGTVTRKLGHKVRLTDDPTKIACTNLYLNEREWTALDGLPARLLRKKRHMVRRDGLIVVVDEHEDGTLIAEIDDAEFDDGTSAVLAPPAWLDVLQDVTRDERWTGAGMCS